MKITSVRNKDLLHKEIADQLRSQILTMPAGFCLEPERVLAERAGVSLVTLRNAMLFLEWEGLIERGAGRRTFVRERKRALSEADHVAIFCGGDLLSPRASYFLQGAVSAVREYFSERDIITQVYLNHREIEDRAKEPGRSEKADSCPELTQALAKKRIRGAVFICGHGSDVWHDTLRQQGVPLVGDFDEEYGVKNDWVEIVRMGIRQLAKRGCRRPALVCWEEEDPRAITIEKYSFVQTFRREVREQGLEFREEWVRFDLPAEDAGSGWESFREIWTSLTEKPDGLVVSDDILMADVARAILELGIDVPGELRIVSHANLGGFYPIPFPVDWIGYDPKEHGRLLGAMLQQLMNGEVPENRTIKQVYRLEPDGGNGDQKAGSNIRMRKSAFGVRNRF